MLTIKHYPRYSSIMDPLGRAQQPELPRTMLLRRYNWVLQIHSHYVPDITVTGYTGMVDFLLLPLKLNLFLTTVSLFLHWKENCEKLRKSTKDRLDTAGILKDHANHNTVNYWEVKGERGRTLLQVVLWWSALLHVPPWPRLLDRWLRCGRHASNS